MGEEKFIEKIRIKNFKGFAEETFTFHERFTVVIGDNGTGKTALLDALAVMAGTWMKGFDGVGYREIGEDEIRRREIGRNHIELQLPVEIEGTRNGDQQLSRTWMHVRKKSGDGNRITNGDAMWLIKDAEEVQRQVREGTQIVLPVIAYHGTGRLWAKLNEPTEKRKKVEYQIRGPRGDGYKNALSVKSSEKVFLSWYKTLEDEWNKFQEPADEAHMEAFKNTLRQMIPAWEQVYFSNREDDLVGFLVTHGGKKEWLPFRMLSDGYRNMIGLVADIAYRCIKLNPHLGINAIAETPGLVLIDELDLHLHPKWQKDVVDDLKKAFPLVQFVVTTHSPFIVQSLKSEELINLNADESTATSDPYKQSIEEVAEQEMLVPDIERSQRFLQMQETAAEYFRLIRAGENSEANGNVRELKQRLDELESLYSDDPAYVALLKAERNSAAHEASN